MLVGTCAFTLGAHPLFSDDRYGISVTLFTVLAEGEPATGGFNPMMLILLALFGVMIFMMFRNRKKMAAAQEERKSKMVPGVKVMTTAGIFGTVVSMDPEDNKVVVEVSPGNQMTFHSQAVNTVVEDAAKAPSDSPADAAAARGELDAKSGDEDGEPGTEQPRP